MPSQYRPQHQTLSSKYQYSHYIDHESTRNAKRDQEMHSAHMIPHTSAEP